ncbi:MAG: alpha/beta fold hydrolase [Hyphomicrobiaceae bacterium]|nr:alpha/beta fold hydrolase [Hyphomicrobiaceae bacterium]
MTAMEPLTTDRLPAGITSRIIANNNGLDVHLLEAGDPGRPTILLLHGFPELAFSWRHVMVPLAAAGFHVIAPDQRGYGRTTGWSADYDGDLAPFRIFNLVRDQLALLAALGKTHVEAVFGHDFGSPVAATAALVRPDIFRRVALMSAPFGGPPAWPKGTAGAARKDGALAGLADPGLGDALAALDPPRKHYQWYYSTRPANADMTNCPQGLHAFLRAYYHMKSADWAPNKPYRLSAWDAPSLAVLPDYYVMPRDIDMAAAVAPAMPSAAAIAACCWLPDADLAIYAAEYGRTGFQGGLQWYRCATGGLFGDDLKTFSGRTIDVPCCFISGKSDWGTYQKPGDLEALESKATSDFKGTHLVEGAGHWVQQEQPEATVRLLREFMAATA